jgi:predicted permease
MWNDARFRLRALFGRKAVEAELDDEIGFHLAQQVEKNLASGMSREEATRQARLAIGGVAQMKEDCRDNWGITLWENTVQDLRYAARQLLHAPAFTVAIVLTLALGIGATTGLFSVADALLLRSLPVPNPQELVVIAHNPARPFLLHNFADYMLMRDHSPDTFGSVAASNEGNAVGFSRVGSNRGDVPDVVSAAFVSDNYFQMLGVDSFAGRVLTAGDEGATVENPPVVLSFAFWQRRFGGSLTVLGQPVLVNSRVFDVVGVAGRRFTGTHAGNAPDLYVPLTTFPSVIPLMRKNWNAPRRQWLVLTARLKPEVNRARAAAQIDSLFAPRASQDRTSGRARCVLLPGARGLSLSSSQGPQPLWIVLLAAGFLLLLACANIAGLLLARAIHRRREIAIRLAMGASRLRLIRQMLTESALLALAGGSVGLLAGLTGARVIVSLVPSGGPLPVSLDVSPDGRVLGFAFLVSLLAALLFGVGPALGSTRRDVTLSLKTGAKGQVRARWLPDSRHALVVAQVAISLVLLVSVSLLARSLGRLDALDLGFSRNGVLLVYVQPGQFGYQGPRAREFYERLRERVAVLPGVKQTCLADYAPLDGGNDSGTVSMPGKGGPVAVETNAITEDYLSTLGIALLAGRNLTARDAGASAAPVGLISETLARNLFRRGDSPLGQRLSYGEQFQAGESWQIVGVVRDARYFGLRAEPVPMVYLPVDRANSRLTLCIRAAGSPELLIPAVRRELAALDPAVPVLEARTMTERVNQQNAEERLLATLFGTFGLMALILAAIGLHGVVAFGVATRSREIGIRTALGARRWDAVARVLTDVWALLGAGAMVGLAAALPVAQLLAGFLYGVRPLDTISFVAPLGVLAAAAGLASYVPARRAAKIDPAAALRHE